MTSILVQACLFLALGVGISAEKAAVLDDYAAKLRGVLPPKWEVRRTQTNAVPYNRGIKPGQQGGIYLGLMGPTVVKGPRGIRDENESVEIWIMGPDYTPIAPKTLAQFAEAQLLGQNDAVVVYCTSFTTDTPSWRTWKQDITERLNLTARKPNKPVERTGASRLRQCASDARRQWARPLTLVVRLITQTENMKSRTAVFFSFLLSAVLVCADETPIVGKLGKPVGTDMTVEGTFQGGKNSWLLISSVNGEKLTRPVLIATDNLDPFAHIPRTLSAASTARK